MSEQYSSDVDQRVPEYIDKSQTKKAQPTHNELIHKVAMEATVAIGSDGTELVYNRTRNRFVPVNDSIIRNELLQRHGRRLSIHQINEIIARIEVRASVSPRIIPMANRFYAPKGDPYNVYQDLDGVSCIHMTPAGREVIPHPNTFMFVPTMSKLPEPKPGGNATYLRKYLGPGLDDDQISLVIGWMLNVYNVHGGRSLLYISGPEGSGKSTLAQKALHVLDPHGPFEYLDQSLPNDMEDLGSHIKNMSILSYSNISNAPRWLSDGICTAVTGMQISNRTKYKNFDLSTAQGKCNAILTGVGFELDRPDARDRCLRIMLSELAKRDEEFDVTKRFYDEQPIALGALCDIVCAIMRNYRKLDNKWKSSDRMDSGRYWVECGAKAMGWDDGYYSQIYLDRRGRLKSKTGNRSTLVDEIYEFLCAVHKEGRWEGRYVDIVDYLASKHGIILSDRDAREKVDKSINGLGDVGIIPKLTPARENGGKAKIELEFTEEEYNKVKEYTRNK